MLKQFAYISSQVIDFSQSELHDLMKQARLKNKRLELTGLLLFDKGVFLQVLEGPTESIDLITLHISEDRRHKNMDIIFTNSSLREREFANWSMGLQILGSNNHKEYVELDNRIKELLTKAQPNAQEAHTLITNYTKLKNSYVNLNYPY